MAGMPSGVRLTGCCFGGMERSDKYKQQLPYTCFGVGKARLVGWRRQQLCAVKSGPQYTIAMLFKDDEGGETEVSGGCMADSGFDAACMSLLSNLLWTPSPGNLG